MGKILSQEEAKGLNIEGLVLVGGCFDILHIGHIRFLQSARKLGNKLMVWLESDATIKRLKGVNRPINTQTERAEVLAGLESVDYVVMLKEILTNSNYSELVREIRPSVIAITEGDEIKEIKENQAKNVGATLEIIENVKNKSTSEIINLINYGRISNT